MFFLLPLYLFLSSYLKTIIYSIFTDSILQFSTIYYLDNSKHQILLLYRYNTVIIPDRYYTVTILLLYYYYTITILLETFCTLVLVLDSSIYIYIFCLVIFQEFVLDDLNIYLYILFILTRKYSYILLLSQTYIYIITKIQQLIEQYLIT